jgi:hypothetical protein
MYKKFKFHRRCPLDFDQLANKPNVLLLCSRPSRRNMPAKPAPICGEAGRNLFMPGSTLVAGEQNMRMRSRLLNNQIEGPTYFPHPKFSMKGSDETLDNRGWPRP